MAGPRGAEERLGLLLVMLPWLMEVGEVPLVDVASRYGLTEAQVQKDLELVALCGLPPFVDEMIDVFVDDGLVFVGVPRLFTRPLRLTAPEGFSLLASGRAAMQLPGADPDGPLGRGLRKLASALSAAGVEATEEPDETAGVAIDLDRPAVTDELVEAVAANAEVAIRYYSPARDEVSDRVIVPRHVFVDIGNWYVIADDERSGERRTFRVDRIEGLEPTGRSAGPAESAVAPEEFFSAAEVERATVRLAPHAQWVVERYPVDAVVPLARPKGWVEVTLPVSSDRWLDRLLIRLGPHARLVEPPARSQGAAELATRILENYSAS